MIFFGCVIVYRYIQLISLTIAYVAQAVSPRTHEGLFQRNSDNTVKSFIFIYTRCCVVLLPFFPPLH